MLDTKTEQKWPLTVSLVNWCVKGHFFRAAFRENKKQALLCRPTQLLYQISGPFVNGKFYISVRICDLHKAVLFVLYNIPSWFCAVAVILYSHKRWYPKGNHFKGSKRKQHRRRQYNWINTTLYQRRNEMSTDTSWNAENKSKTVIVVYETKPNETFSLRTCEGNSTNNKRKIQGSRKSTHTNRSAYVPSGKYKAIRWQIKRCTSHSGDPIPLIITDI